MPLKIDGPAGRQEVNKKYRDNYDGIFSRTSLTFCGSKTVTSKCADCTTPQCHLNRQTPKKSTKDGGNHAKTQD